MAKFWYALRSKPRKEEALWHHALEQGMEVFLPRVRVHRVNPRARKLQPYFPGYMFLRADLEESGLSRFQWMPYSVGLVTFGGEPAIVPDHLIYEVRRKVEEIQAAGGEVFAGLNTGDTVRINEGPFKGYEAIFDARLPGNERVRVLLEFLGSQRKVQVELDAGQIQQVKKQEKRKGSETGKQ